MTNPIPRSQPGEPLLALLEQCTDLNVDTLPFSGQSAIGEILTVTSLTTLVVTGIAKVIGAWALAFEAVRSSLLYSSGWCQVMPRVWRRTSRRWWPAG